MQPVVSILMCMEALKALGLIKNDLALIPKLAKEIGLKRSNLPFIRALKQELVV